MAIRSGFLSVAQVHATLLVVGGDFGGSLKVEASMLAT